MEGLHGFEKLERTHNPFAAWPLNCSARVKMFTIILLSKITTVLLIVSIGSYGGW
jgi:hypothetical protein